MTAPLLDGVTSTPTAWIHEHPDVVSRLRREPMDRVLVLGCGDGADALELAEAFPNITVYGIDADAGAVANAQRAARMSPARDRLAFFRGSPTAPKVPMVFDVVVAVGLLTDPDRPDRPGVNAALWTVAALSAPDGLALLDSTATLTAQVVRPAGFEYVQRVGTSVHDAPAYLLRKR